MRPVAYKKNVPSGLENVVHTHTHTPTYNSSGYV